MKRTAMIAAAAALVTGAGAVAQVRTHIWSQGAVRNHTTQVCIDRAKSVAMTLGMQSGSDHAGTWLVRPGSDITTVVRCDLPQWVLIITAAANGGSPRAQNDEVVRLYNRIGGN